MISTVILLVVCFTLLILLLTFLVYTVGTGLVSVPFVPTSGRDLNEVLRFAKLKKGQVFVDLGSGDGRLVIRAAKDFFVEAIGVEINPLLVWFARLWTLLSGLTSARFVRQSLYSYPLDQANVVYLFLFPRMMGKIEEKIKRECKKGTIIISRGFSLPTMKPYHTLPTKTFETFYYRV